ncbi:MAG: MFS transporter [Pirellulales bacterium]|nr:MFS transporter [Pirellulales bacterium]
MSDAPSPYASPPPASPNSTLRGWQIKIFASVWVTYFAFYLCRYNMPVAKGRLCDAYGWSNEEFGIILTALTIFYAMGQFVNGQLADRFGTRIMVGLGVLGSVLMNLAVFGSLLWFDSGSASSQSLLDWVARFWPEDTPPEVIEAKLMLWSLAAFWGVNGFVQAMGWAPMVRLMTHWFPVQGRGKIMGLLGTCYQFGGAAAWALAFFLTGYYVQEYGGDWRMAFAIPSVMFAVVGLAFFLIIRNGPEDVGLPPIDHGDETHKTGNKPTGASTKPSLVANIARTLSNPYVWVVAGVFFFLDVNRYCFVNWLPGYLDDARQVVGDSPLMDHLKEIMKACIHPLAGSLGAIAAGWATDRFFGGRRAPVIAILLILLGAFSILFPYVNPANATAITLVVAIIGFCTYGPHILMVGHAAQDFGKKSGSAGAAGFIDGMGYVGASLAGWGMGRLIDASGYVQAFHVAGYAAIAGGALAVVLWSVGPDTYSHSKS